MNNKNQKQQHWIGHAQKIRYLISDYLPVGQSFIPFDILLTVLNGDRDGNDLTVKALFASLPYSDMGIRYHFKRLIEKEWISLHNGDADTRIKRVKATLKLKNAFLEISKHIEAMNLTS